VKPNRGPWFYRRVKHLLDRGKHDLKLCVIAAFHRFDFLSQLLMGRQGAAQLDESAHYRYVHFDRTPASKDTRKHRNTLFRKRIGWAA